MANLNTHKDRSWIDGALCADDEPDSLFVQGVAQHEVRKRCLECPVRLHCLADALQCQTKFGVWGGLTERERRALLRRYRDMEDWYQWLVTSDDALARELRRTRIPQIMALING